MPPHSVYLETHLGGGAIMKRKPGALRNIGIDCDAKALEGFCCDYPVELVQDCCHRYLVGFPFDGTELVYCDPPYLHSTRKSDRRYRYDYETGFHEGLLALLRDMPCSVMILGYLSRLYDDRLGDWGSVSLQVMNQAGVVTEKVWFNFVPDRVHWARYAGRNFTHRQMVMRKVQSWGRRYRGMGRGECLAVLARGWRWRRSEYIGMVNRMALREELGDRLLGTPEASRRRNVALPCACL